MKPSGPAGAAPQPLLLAALSALLLVACGAAASPPSPGASATPLPSGAAGISLLASGNKFDVTEVQVRAGEAFAVLLRNEDRDPHNFELRDEAGNSIFKGDLFSGPAELQHVLPALPAGRYAFLCTAHPYMKGTLLAD